ncbi:family 43 glycosylhydrolase [Segatella buccae]
MKLKTITVLMAALMLSMGINAEGRKYANPVIPGVADAGCIRYAGNYYLGGVATHGDLYVSRNLVDWPEKIHVFDLDNQWTHGTGARNNQIHADDLSYINGQFNLLFSVNYWGKDKHLVHIVHAVSPTVTGPYRDVTDSQWMENRIDPMVFRDDDGRLYLYMVKFTDGNTIWGRPMNQDLSFCGDAVQQFSSQPGTWETLDNRVAEGPFVIKYRRRYFMMYNANHTAPEFGNYRLGVCEASSPLEFNPGGKYSYPVVEPNMQGIEDSHANLLLYGTGSYEPLRVVSGKDGKYDTLQFRLTGIPAGNVYLKLRQNGDCKVSLNGNDVNSGESPEFRLFSINKAWLKQGMNTIVTSLGKNGQLLPLALYDFASDTTDDLLVTPGQPNIVRGPNGWEWWLVYMANQGWKRSQFIDRIHFTGGRLTVDGITGPRTGGFHPAPALPQYSGTSIDSIPFSDAYLLELTFRSKQKRQGISIGSTNVVLPDTLSADCEHEWRIEKNHGLLTVWIDKILVTDHLTVDTESRLTLIGDEKLYDLAYISYNEGWDEYADKFSGWNETEMDREGMILSEGVHLKGNPANAYEFSVQTDDHSADRGNYGVMAAYKDEKNYVLVSVDGQSSNLVITQCEKGKVKRTAKPLACEEVVYPDLKYTDTFEKQYRFDSDTWLSSVSLPHAIPDNDPYAKDLGIGVGHKEHLINDVAATQNISYLDNGKWVPLSYKIATSPNPEWQKIEFQKIKTRALRFINATPTDMQRNIYRIKVGEERQSVNQLRIDRQGKEIHIFLNNRDYGYVTLKKDLPTRCGLFSDGQATVTVNNTLYYVVTLK